MGNVLGGFFATGGFAFDPNLSPNNQSFALAVLAVVRRSGIASGTGGGGTFTGVGLADASTTPVFDISNTPITTSGTLSFALKTQVKNKVLAGPASGANAQPTFRLLVDADLPGGTAAGTGSLLGVSGTMTGAGTAAVQVTGVPVTGTGGTWTLVVNTFAGTNPGVVPSSAGGTLNFLRADGAFAAPPGSGLTGISGTMTGAGTAAVQISNVPLTSNGTFTLTVNTFAGTNPGVVPSSPGGTMSYLRSDGSWANVPAYSTLYSQIAVDFICTSVTALANTGNVQGSLPVVTVAVGTYEFECIVFAHSGAGLNMDLGFGTATIAFINYGIQYFANSDNGNVGASLGTTTQLFSPSIGNVAATPQWFWLKGNVSFSSSGQFGLRAAQASSSSSQCVIHKQSWLRLTQPAATISGIVSDNPAVKVSTTATNGTATTFMRSDAAPAIDQAMSPTWTGTHTFTTIFGTMTFTGGPTQYVIAGTTIHKINGTGSPTMQGYAPTAANLQDMTPDYVTGIATLTGAGIPTLATGTFTAVRNGKVTTIWLPAMNAAGTTSNNAVQINCPGLSGPFQARDNDARHIVPITGAGTAAPGLIIINAASTVFTLQVAVTGGTFTGTLTRGLAQNQYLTFLNNS